MANYLRFESLLGDAENREIYRNALAKREVFTQSRTSPSQYYPDWRRSTVVYDAELGALASRMEREVRARARQALVQLAMPSFEIGSVEVQLTSHNDGEYYHWHVDNGTRDTRGRFLSFVYYFHGLPRAFSGGELVVYGDDGTSTVIEPRNDTLVLFGSHLRHEVKPVSCPSRRFEDGRFTLNGWLRREVVPRDEYFDAKIFEIPSQRSPAPAASASASRPSEPLAPASAGAAPSANAEATTLLDLYANLFRQSAMARHIDVRTALSGAEFFERYYFANRPVLLKGVMQACPAVQNWSPGFFAEHYGSVRVSFTTHRDADRDYEVNFAESVRTISLQELVARLEAEPESNDYYLVARNLFFDQMELAPLRQDLEPPRDIIDSDAAGAGTVKLWLGPKGTITPLHHDEHSILFAQVYGRKRFKLIPAFDARHLYVRRRFYSAVDPENVDLERYPSFQRASVLDVVVEPGDVLFLPVGWWHWVKSLDVSISATFCHFRVAGGNTRLRG